MRVFVVRELTFQSSDKLAEAGGGGALMQAHKRLRVNHNRAHIFLTASLFVFISLTFQIYVI